MRTRPATAGDLEAVFGDLSQRLADDYASTGVYPDAVRDAFVMNLKEGRGHALIEDEKPLAVITWHERDGIVHTLFAAQESFFTASTVRFCKAHIKRLQALEGNYPVQYRSGLARSEVVKWFRVIGFVAKESTDTFTIFELSPTQTS